MYLEHFKLRECPFRLTPGAGYHYLSEGLQRAKAYLSYSLWSGEGFVVITGDVGCGKSLLIQQWLAELNGKNIVVVKLALTRLTDIEFLQAVLVELGQRPFSANKIELMGMFNTCLVEFATKGKSLLLVIDDAHNFNKDVFEMLRVLSAIDFMKKKMLPVVLCGQPGLNTLFESFDMEHVSQHVRFRCRIEPLTQTEMVEYITHRLRAAGAVNSWLFAAETIPVIHGYTGGIPRLINILCDTALVSAYADAAAHVTVEALTAALADLGWVPYVKRRDTSTANNSANQFDSVMPNEPVFSELHRRLSQLESLPTAMITVADRLSGIEALLSELVRVLHADGKEFHARSNVKTGDWKFHDGLKRVE
ncbi:MAG: AAA family ATPase [Gammaproteobacteria bacterium]|nr:AAA family ATPase [Gammaproteobacteria bacterium]